MTRYIVQKSNNEVLVNKGTTIPVQLDSVSVTDDQFLVSVAEAFGIAKNTIKVVTEEPDQGAGIVDGPEPIVVDYDEIAAEAALKILLNKYGTLTAAEEALK